MKNIKYIVNVETGESLELEMTAEELELEAAEREMRETEEASNQAEAAVKQARRQALLDKLGITAEEAKLLLG